MVIFVGMVIFKTGSISFINTWSNFRTFNIFPNIYLEKMLTFSLICFRPSLRPVNLQFLRVFILSSITVCLCEAWILFGCNYICTTIESFVICYFTKSDIKNFLTSLTEISSFRSNQLFDFLTVS